MAKRLCRSWSEYERQCMLKFSKLDQLNRMESEGGGAAIQARAERKKMLHDASTGGMMSVGDAVRDEGWRGAKGKHTRRK